MTDLVARNSYGPPKEHEIMVYQVMAKAAVDSKMYRGIGEQAGVMMIMLAARELGIPPCQALNGGINIINGKAEISARMMSALIRKAGHEIKIKTSTDDICVLVGKRADTQETQEASFSVADAQRAGLVKQGGGWVKFPKDMCFARALSRLARQLFSDVIGIGYVEGEIQATEAEIALPEDITPIVETNRIDELLSKFPEEEKENLLEYIHVVSMHFDWTEAECVNKFLEDPKLEEKFKKWKNKTKAV